MTGYKYCLVVKSAYGGTKAHRVANVACLKRLRTYVEGNGHILMNGKGHVIDGSHHMAKKLIKEGVDLESFHTCSDGTPTAPVEPPQATEAMRANDQDLRHAVGNLWGSGQLFSELVIEHYKIKRQAGVFAVITKEPGVFGDRVQLASVGYGRLCGYRIADAESEAKRLLELALELKEVVREDQVA